MLEVGQQAPEFSINNQNGDTISLSDFRGRKVVLFFYPKDNTPGCTKEACNFRDNIEVYEKNNVVVLGISIDDERSHQRFIEKQDLNFTLLADTEKTVVNDYGVWGEKKNYGRTYMGTFRKTFLVDEEGKIARIYDKVKVATHAEDILADWDLQ